MKNLFNYIQQYKSKFAGNTSDNGPWGKSVVDIDGDPVMGDDGGVSEQYDIRRKSRQRSNYMSILSPYMTPLNTSQISSSGKASTDNEADEDNEDNETDEYISLFPDVYKFRGITMEHQIKEKY